MSKVVAMEGHGPGVLGTVKVRVSTVCKRPVSLVKPGSSLGFSLTSWNTSDFPFPHKIVGDLTDGTVQDGRFLRILGRAEELLAVPTDLKRT